MMRITAVDVESIRSERSMIEDHGRTQYLKNIVKKCFNVSGGAAPEISILVLIIVTGCWIFQQHLTDVASLKYGGVAQIGVACITILVTYFGTQLSCGKFWEKSS